MPLSPAPSASPPDTDVPTLAALKRRLADIQAGTGTVRLGKRSQHVLATLIETPQQSAVTSISDLAARVGVNASTLTRLAQRLGFAGFAELQAVFRREITEGGQHFYSDLAARLSDDRPLNQQGEQGEQRQQLSRLARLGRQESANFAGLVERIDPEVYVRCARRLATSRRVRIHGQRQFACLAQFLAYGLGMLRADVGELDAGHQGVADGLASLDRGDVLLAASCFPYTASVIETAKIAARHGIIVIALTDGEHSPLAQVATDAFYVPSDSLFYSNSMCAFLLLAQGLLTEVADTLGDEGMRALKHRETLIQELGAAL
ncbi:MurR/RpiR family transcriptional regulator [Halomonas sp. V046]|uniref:MurR/RpiR family transcriptional regulator n=1 Tax=Halomonas sp. V046 TaxID=3459611 RepID=UPI004043DCF6